MIGNLATSDLRSAELSQHAEIIPTLFKTLLADYCSEEMSIKVSHIRRTSAAHTPHIRRTYAAHSSVPYDLQQETCQCLDRFYLVSQTQKPIEICENLTAGLNFGPTPFFEYKYSYFFTVYFDHNWQVKHAVLSAIKNLTICKSAKPLIAPYMSDLKSYVMQGDKPMLVYKVCYYSVRVR